MIKISVATCPVSDLNTLNLNNRPTLSTTNPVSYLDYLNMTCDVPGKGTIVNQQQCLFDKKTNTYALYGASYECEGELVYIVLVIWIIYCSILFLKRKTQHMLP